MKRFVLSIIAVCLVAGASVFAQTAPAQPGSLPPVLRVYREEVKPGKGAAHAKTEAGWPKAFGKAATTNYYLALRSVSGANEALFLESHPSYASVEKADAAVDKNAALTAELNNLSEEDGAHLSNTRTLMLSLNEELSRPGSDLIAVMRYFVITTYRVRPGHLAEFIEARRLVKSVSTQNYAVYAVSSGAPNGTFMSMRAIKSLGELDPNPSAKPLSELLGPNNFKKYNELVASSVLNAENAIYALSPEMSYLSKETMAADPTFWAPKPKPASKSTVKKEAKAAATTP